MKLNQINNSLNYLPAILIIALFSLSMILPLSSENTDFQQSNIRLSAEKSNSKILQDILIAKINEYEEQDYFTQYHYPSIQATYYSLYILDALDSLDDINQFSLRDFLMESYDNSSGFFLDQFAKRYLDTDFCIKYYPLSSLLLTTCYAVLSLEIINFTNAINIQTTIDFILSCYDSNTGGFCGRPIETGLHEYFLTPTLDNTYFAVATLELLLDSWNEFSDLKNEVIAFVNGLQLDNVYSFIDGSFYNDENSEFESLSCDEPNILSSYYGIKTLEIFDMEDSIRIDDFHMFLDNLYDDQNKFYRYSNFFVPYNNFANVPGNALVLELANITQYPTINETMVLDFLMENRNELGLWKSCSEQTIYELIDTFQIIRGLKESKHLSILNSTDRSILLTSLLQYESYKGFSMEHRANMLLPTIYSIVESCELYDRIPELELHSLYTQLKNTYFEPTHLDISVFRLPLQDYDMGNKRRTFPIEYNNHGTHENTDFIDSKYSHKFTYMALKSMESMFKLDDFENEFNITELMDSIIQSQNLNGSSDTFGAFFSSELMQYTSPHYQDQATFFESTYYSIKSLELLCESLEIGNLTTLGFDKNALLTYISRKQIDTGTTLYFQPKTSQTNENILKNTYYMVEILLSLDEYTLDTQKIENLIMEKINYSNMINIYYCYKLNDLLELEIEFNVLQTHALFNCIYNDELKEFYESNNRVLINQELLRMINEIARNDKVRMVLDYEPVVMLGSETNITVILTNLILHDFGEYLHIKFEDSQLPSQELIFSGNGSYKLGLTIPINPSIYPTLSGNISLYDGATRIKSTKIEIETTYNLFYTSELINNTDFIDLNVNISMESAQGHSAPYSGEVYMDITFENTSLGSKIFSSEEQSDHEIFMSMYNLSDEGSYIFDIYFRDAFNSTYRLLEKFEFSYYTQSEEPDDPDPEPEPNPDPEPEHNPSESANNKFLNNSLGIGTGILILLATIGGFFYSYKQKKTKN